MLRIQIDLFAIKTPIFTLLYLSRIFVWKFQCIIEFLLHFFTWNKFINYGQTKGTIILRHSRVRFVQLTRADEKKNKYNKSIR